MPRLSTSPQAAAIALCSGQVVAVPTETVYGLAADAENEMAVQEIFRLKGRPPSNPLIVHVLDGVMAQRYAQWNALAERLAVEYWPGPLTLVLPRRLDCPAVSMVSAGGETIALRSPAHPLMREVISQAGRGIAAPSANRSGRISPTQPEHVREEFLLSDLLILDGGACEIGVESTVVDCTAEMPVVLRPGSIMIDDCLTVSICASASLKSPGLLASHYAPGLPVRLNARSVRPGEALLGFGPKAEGATLNLSPDGHLDEAARNLFAMLRALDRDEYEAIAVMPLPDEGVGQALNDRLRRAAAPRV